ncbi:diaminopimelate decarboxylase, partial [bacterium]|nr:diaminopimelate decarboxylase [bacterium]
MLDKILKEFSSPFYLYDEDKIKDKINFLNNLELEFPRKFNFAVKANPNLAILNLIHRCGFGAEVVSAGELFKSLKAGFEPEDIIFDGPGKTDFDLKYAITQKVHSINVENIEEVEFINDYSLSKGLKTNIGIRINPDIDGSTMDKITTGLSGGKFGISIDQIDFDTISNLEGVNLKTLSVHIGSQITDYQKLLSSYENLIKIANEQNLKNNINIDTLDFGGGFAVLDHSDKEINFDSWKNNCNKILSGKNYNIIFEPGRFIVADSCELISKVLYIKNSGNKKIAIIDCSFSEYIRPALYDIKP